MKVSLSFYHKFFNILVSLSLILQTFAPVLAIQTAYAEEETTTVEETTPTPEPTVETTPAPEVTAAPTEEPTPEVTVEPTVEPTVTAEPTNTENNTPSNSENNQPSGNTTNENAQSQAPPATETPTVTPDSKLYSQQDENANLSATILENVSAPSLEPLDLESIVEGGSASLVTDKADYAPTDTALISGSGLTPGNTYSLTISSSDAPATSTTVNVIADDKGGFVYPYQLDGNYRPNYLVVLKDGEEVVATTTFTDSAVQTNSNAACMQDVPGSPSGLVCTANDVSIASVNNIQILDDGCKFPGDTVTFTATWDIQSTSSERYDIGLYFATAGQASAKTGSNSCSVSTLANAPVPPWSNLDGDACGDITSAAQVHPQITMTATCNPDPTTNLLKMPYCTSWDNNSGGVCSTPSQAFPSTKSKCNCQDGFTVPIQVPPSSIEVVKNLVPSNDPGLFNLQVNGVTASTSANVGNGGTTGKVGVTAGSNTIGETAGTNTSLSNYTSSVSCVLRGTQTAVATTGTNPWTLNVATGKDIVCTITNNKQNGSVKVNKLADTNGDGTFETSNPGNFTWSLDGSGTNAMGSTVASVSAGVHSVNENSAANYHFVSWYATSDTSKTCANSTNTTLPASVTVNSNQTTEITLCNAINTGTVVVHKDVQGPAGEALTDTSNNFKVKIDDANEQSITDNGTVTYNNVIAGNHTITESLIPSGYSIYGIAQTAGTAGNTGGLQVAVTTGQTTHVYVTNRQNSGTITVVKVVKDAAGNTTTDHHTFTVQLNGANDDNTLADNNNVVYTVNPGGPYTVAELDDANYDELGCKLVSGADATNFSVLPGGQVTITCTNQQKPGSISGYKFKADGVTGILGWSVSLYSCVSSGTNCNTFVTSALTDGTGFYSFTGLVTGFYQVVEDLVAGFTPVSVTSHNVTVVPNTLSENNNFANFKNIDIKVCKEDNNQNSLSDWGMTLNVDGVASGSAQATGRDGCYVFTNLGPGHSYSVTEEDKDGWSPVSDPNFTHDFGVPQDGVNQTYTFVNVQLGTIIVKKTMVGGTDSFEFSGDVAGTISVNNETLSTPDVLPGEYSSTETTLAGWDLTDVTCSDENSVGSKQNAQATFNVEAGETITCTFTNTKKGHLIVHKTTLPGEDETEFGITASGSGIITNGGAGTVTDALDKDYEVTPGTYSVSEGKIAGWAETGNTCDDVEVAAGETEECTITNTKLGNVVVVKFHDENANGTQDEGEETLNDWEIQLGQASQFTGQGGDPVDGQVTFSDVLPGEFTLSETVQEDWFQSNIFCTEKEGIYDTEEEEFNFTLNPGENLTCYIGNYQKAHIIVIKNVVNPDGDPVFDNSTNFDFRIRQGQTLLESFSLTDDQQSDTYHVNPGTYDVNEVLSQSDYEFDGCTAVYDDEAVGVDIVTEEEAGKEVTLDSNDTVVVTCVNKQKTGTITGEKWNDQNGNGERDEEPNLEGWVIFIDSGEEPNGQFDQGEQSTTTDVNGEYSFTLNPGTYVICEIVQNGWEQTYPGNTEEGPECHEVTIGSNDNRSGSGRDFGNHATDPILHIEKTNDKLGQDLHAGDTVVYTITLTNTEGLETEGLAENVTVTDLLPQGFVYQSGSWQATLNGNPLSVSEPTYASPGTWTLGDLQIGDVVVLTYTAKINGDQEAGLYKDVAWGKGESVDDTTILALAQPTGFVDDNFVGTEINVVKDPEAAGFNVENKVTQDVLGAATSLPATGANTQLLVIASMLILIGLSLTTLGYIIRRRYV